MPKMDFTNYTDITIEDIKKWKDEIKAQTNSRFDLGNITMDENRVYFNGPMWGSCSRELWNKLLKEAIENLGK